MVADLTFASSAVGSHYGGAAVASRGVRSASVAVARVYMVDTVATIVLQVLCRPALMSSVACWMPSAEVLEARSGG